MKKIDKLLKRASQLIKPWDKETQKDIIKCIASFLNKSELKKLIKMTEKSLK